MQLTIVTLYPEMFTSFLACSLLGEAIKQGIVKIDFIPLRSFGVGRNRQVDDGSYGGGPGMVIKPDVLEQAIAPAINDDKKPRIIYMSPQGEKLTQKKAQEWLAYDHLLLVCGRFEGVDERWIEQYVDEEISLGDYVLNGGEVAAMVVVETVARLLPGVIGDPASLSQESHNHGLLDHPHFTRPVEWQGKKVPDVLLSGHHAMIEQWRRRQALLRTLIRRPDMLAEADLSAIEKKWLTIWQQELDDSMGESF